MAGSRKKAAFDDDVLRMLEVIAIQAAQAVLRAQLFEQMERMATTDGLTGLLNHRTFQSRVDEALATPGATAARCSLILTDIDHFKSVNDTYGHPTGDQVLKGVARILREKARDTDVVARYGGEEFAIIMPETDAKGALVIAERIREAVMAEVFQTEHGAAQGDAVAGHRHLPRLRPREAGAHRSRPTSACTSPSATAGTSRSPSRRCSRRAAGWRRGARRVWG